MSRINLNPRQKKILAALQALRVDGKPVSKKEIEQVMLIMGIDYNDQVLQLLDVRDIDTDYSYQRSCNPNHVENHGEDWDPLLCGVFRVCERTTGRLYSVDNNHTKHSILWRMSNDLPVNPVVLSLVRKGTSRREEARMFVGLNDNKSVNGNAKFRANIVKRESPFIDIDREVKKQGFSLAILPPGRSKERPANSITSIGKLLEVWDHCPGQLGNALTVLKRTWGQAGIVPRSYCKGEYIHAIAYMLMTQFDRDRPLGISAIVGRLKGISLLEGVKQAAVNQAQDGKTHGRFRVPYLAAWLCNSIGISSQEWRRAA